MISLSLAAMFFGFLAGWSVKSEKPCQEFTVVEHLSDEEAERLSGLEVLDLEKGRVTLAEMKRLTEIGIDKADRERRWRNW